MSLDRLHVEWVRQVVTACGGWNRRSRGALLAWARAEGIDDARLERLLTEALATPRRRTEARVPAAEPTRERSASTSVPRPRWWLAALAVVGLAASVWLLVRLAPRIESPRAPAKPAVAASPSAVETARTMPPAPVSFPTPPEIRAASAPAEPDRAAPLGQRPAGELSRMSVQAWREAFASTARAWPAMAPAARRTEIEALAAWLAGGGASDLAALRAAREQAQSGLDPGARMLADALDAMIAAQVAASPRVSSIVAADPAFASQGRVDASRALVAWASAQVPRLVADLGAVDARARWAGWLQAVGSLEGERERASLALGAIDALLRSDARLDGQGLAADALGSLLAGVPSRPDLPGFVEVRDAWAGWLRDARVSSARLWALGGIWRARGEAPDAWLLPGERDGAQARAALAERWSRLDAAAAEPAWKRLLAEWARPVAREPDARLDARIDDLVARVRLARRSESPSGALGALPVPARPVVATDARREPEVRWSRSLSDPSAEARQRALREMRTEAPDALAAADAAALAARAIGAQAREERSLAQEILQGPLADSAVMRDAVAREVAVCADPRLVSDFLERLLGVDLPASDAGALRAAALARLLRSPEAAGDASAATSRLAEEVQAWAELPDAGGARTDPAEPAWALADRACLEAGALRPPSAVQPLVAGIADRSRRLARLAPDGPRAFAAALALLCDARAAKLSVLHAARAEDLRRLADAASAARARAGDAVQQAAISLDAIAGMHLLVGGAPVPIQGPAPRDAAAPAESARAAARVELERAEGLLAGESVERRRLAGALRHAVALDPQVAGEAALAWAQSCDDPPERARHLEAAALLGDGAALPPPDALDAEDGLALAQLLAWSDRGQVDRLAPAKLPARSRAAAARLAAASGMSLEDLLSNLRQGGSDARARLAARLRAAALHGLDRRAAGWPGAFAAGEAGPLAEGDAAQPWRFTIPGG